MFSATVICQDCGNSFTLESVSKSNLDCSVRNKKYCPECAYKRHKKNAAEYRKTHKKKKQPRKDPDTFSTEDFDRAYERFFAKRGIDIKKEVSFNDDPFPI